MIGSIVEKNINASHGMKSLADELFAVLLARQVCGEQIALSSSLLHELLGLFGILLLVWQISNGRVCALHGEQESGGTAYARIASRDESLLSLELAGSLVVLEAAIVIGQLIIDCFNGQLLFLARERLIRGIWQEAYDYLEAGLLEQLLHNLNKTHQT